MIEPALIPGITADRDEREARSYDFGRMIRRIPGGVARPQSAAEVSGIVRRAISDGVQLAIRGGAHSQGGQSLTDGGLAVDTMCLDRVELLGRDLVRAQGGTPWGKIVDALGGTRRLPRVLADIGEVTVGGTLSAGGLGTTSHRYGAQVAQVEQLEVVTGTGERVRCSRSRNANLFDAVRGGQGQFGVITDAWIRLREAGERIRRFELRYRDFERFTQDFERILDESRFDHLRVEMRIHDSEVILNAWIEYDQDHKDSIVLEGLQHDELSAVRDTDKVSRAMMLPKWGFSRRNYHPWRDWFLPWDALPTVLAQPWLGKQWVPRPPVSWTGIYPVRTGMNDAPLLMLAEGERVFSYSIFIMLGRYERANELAGRLKEIDRTLVALGAKSYLSGSVDYGRGQWAEHYGEMLGTGLKWKNEFDPKRVFQGEGMPF